MQIAHGKRNIKYKLCTEYLHIYKCMYLIVKYVRNMCSPGHVQMWHRWTEAEENRTAHKSRIEKHSTECHIWSANLFAMIMIRCVFFMVKELHSMSMWRDL